MPTTTPPVYLIFGANGAVGSALARRIGATKAMLALSGQDAEVLDALAAEVGAASFPADPLDDAAMDEVVTRTVKRFGRLDGVATCMENPLPGWNGDDGNHDERHTLRTHVANAFAILRSSARVMATQDRGGSIVLAYSAAAPLGVPGSEAVAAVRGGLSGLVRSASATYARAGIRVNAVTLGLGSRKGSHEPGPLETPEDISETVRWLLGPEAGSVTGQTLGVRE